MKREGTRWFVVLSCDDVPARPLAPTGAVVGIDMGIVSFLTTSSGEHVPNPRHARSAADRLAGAQRALKTFPRRKPEARTLKHRRAVEKVTKLHRKIRRRRLDHAHKTALTLVASHDLIAHEALPITNMLKAPAPKPDPTHPGGYLPNGANAKTGLNHSISDAGWGVFLTILAAKAEEAGRTLIAVNPANTSRTCAQCGHCAKDNRPTQTQFICQRCEHTAHADVNAAANILRAGLALQDAEAA